MTGQDQESAAYDRGHAAGGIEARLAGHDRHFERINGSIEKLANEMHAQNEEAHAQTLAIQRLADQAEASAKTALALAAALKAADEDRRNAGERHWTPVQRTLAVIAGIGVLIGAVIGLKALLG